MSNKKYTIDMCSGPLPGKIIRFALPVMAASAIQLLFNAADVVVVGKFAGDASQAAVTSTTALINLLIGLFSGLGIGVNVVVARALGSGERGRIRAVVENAVLLAVVCGFALTGIGLVLAPALLRWMDCPDSLIGLSSLYLRVYFWGLPGALLYNFGSALLRSQGDTKRPMRFLTFAGVLNVVLNLIFVVVFRWDVAGVAAATALSKWASGLLVLRCLIRETGYLHLDVRQIRPDLSVIAEIARIGLPAGIQGSLFSLANVVIQTSVNSMGEVAMAGSGAAVNIGGFINVTGHAFYTTAMTFGSQNVGAKKPGRVDRVYAWCALFGFLFPLVAGMTASFFGEQLLRLYSSDPAVIAMGMVRMRLVVSMYCFCGLMHAGSGIMRGLGYSLTPMLVSLVGTCALRILWVNTVFARVGTPESLFVCLPVSWAVTGLCHFICFMIVRTRVYGRMRSDAERT